MINYSPHKISSTPFNRLSTLVENRTVIDFENAQLNIFETHKHTSGVHLKFNDLVVTSMISGKKIMHLDNKNPFDYLPGETVIVEPGETMKIDFPTAKMDDPTQCLALAISKEKISAIIDKLNDLHPKAEQGKTWKIDDNFFHIHNNYLLTEAINQLVKVSLFDQSVYKGKIAELKTEEIIIRLMQTQARHYIESKYYLLSNNPFASVVSYIKNNLHIPIEIEELCKIACMSKAVFYRKFLAEFGISPAAFIMYERIKHAQWLLLNSADSVASIAYSVGFNNISHFTTLFKKITGITPGNFNKKNQNIQ